MTIHEVGTHDDAHYFTMEFIEGTSLDRMIAQRKISRDEALAVLEKVARAVDYAVKSYKL